MEAKELRIGNYIHIDNPMFIEKIKSPFVINEINSNKKTISGYWINDVFEDQRGQFLKFIKPIPLTEEWLLKFGSIRHESRSFPSYNLYGLQINYINGIYHEYVRQIDIKSVHQLQNLYFALTGGELTIKTN